MTNTHKSQSSDTAITADLVGHVATLASLPFDKATQSEQLIEAFEETMAVIENLKEVDTKTVEPTHQVTGLENIWRDDVIDSNRMFTQEEALVNASKTHDGFFVVPPVLDQS